ncbi:MAG: glycoside hydrolase family 2 TIM barrel-domain containing protein [Clostridiales bacterium]|nr:glycoside hydrolase family 2 TIM barrel-domain containing protein [Clostridiales bacterium]
MRQKIDLLSGWQFTGLDGQTVPVCIPHTWNNIDGQDGGNNYKRGACRYETTFPLPAFDPESQEVWIELDGVNASAQVVLNGQEVCRHDGGYATFRAELTALLQVENTLTVTADNSVNDRVYPQKADFTFYGGIYRGVRLLVVNKAHFALDYLGSSGIRITATPEGKGAQVRVQSHVTAGEVVITLRDHKARVVGTATGTDVTIPIDKAHRWHGVEDPYLYTCHAQVQVDGVTTDALDIPFGVRSFRVDPKEGFILNDKPYPLHGVSRHQDRKGLGNAITRAHHEEDIRLIAEMGCNTVRLAHYQHDQYFYDLCDRYGMVVWAEIPYISEHMVNGRENTILQMKELIEQNYNHACIVCWGVSNEITISTRRADRKDMLDNHRVLNDLIHQTDPSRFTTLACYAMCGPFNPVAHITDVVSWNLYLGWYVPGLFLNDLWISFFHLCYPNTPLGYSEYGAEGMPNLHAAHPRRNDHTEEYQAKYHEFMVKCFRRHPYMWANHVWNMFDFAADARDQGGEPGMNHKGLVTFDRRTKKDAFYLYKANWSREQFVHICSKRYVERTERTTTIKVYSTEKQVTLIVNGKTFATKRRDDHVFTFRVPMAAEMKVEAVCGHLRDTATFRRVEKKNPAYILPKVRKRQKSNWV